VVAVGRGVDGKFCNGAGVSCVLKSFVSGPFALGRAKGLTMGPLPGVLGSDADIPGGKSGFDGSEPGMSGTCTGA